MSGSRAYVQIICFFPDRWKLRCSPLMVQMGIDLTDSHLAELWSKRLHAEIGLEMKKSHLHKYSYPPHLLMGTPGDINMLKDLSLQSGTVDLEIVPERVRTNKESPAGIRRFAVVTSETVDGSWGDKDIRAEMDFLRLCGRRAAYSDSNSVFGIESEGESSDRHSEEGSGDTHMCIITKATLPADGQPGISVTPVWPAAVEGLERIPDFVFKDVFGPSNRGEKFWGRTVEDVKAAFTMLDDDSLFTKSVIRGICFLSMSPSRQEVLEAMTNSA